MTDLGEYREVRAPVGPPLQPRSWAWPDEAIDILKRGRASGDSFAQISVTLSSAGYCYSRNACIGRADRLGLLGQQRIIILTPEQRRVRSKAKNRKRSEQRKAARQAAGPTIRPVRHVPRYVEVASLNIAFADLTHEHCRFPYGEGPYAFCGCPRWSGSPYCESHHALCNQVGTARE